MPETAHQRLRSVLDLPVCRIIRDSLSAEPCHLVGGLLRDAWLGHLHRDVDIVVKDCGRELGQRLARHGSTRLVTLGGERFAAYRLKLAGSVVDIWDRGRDSLAQDLRRRDLTVHSFALDITSGEIIDPFGGLADLRHRRLRMTTPESFGSDALRILRLCRCAAHLGDFTLDPRTIECAMAASPGLRGVASERIQTELATSLTLHRAVVAIRLWIHLQVLPGTLLGPAVDAGSRRRLTAVCDRAFDALEGIATSLPDTADLAAARLGLLLRIVEDEIGLERNRSLKGLQASGYLSRVLRDHTARLLVSPAPPTHLTDRRWYLHSFGKLWPDAIAYAAGVATLSSRQSSASPVSRTELAALIDLAKRDADGIFDPPALVSGDDLQRQLGLEPGVRLGQILARLRRSQIEGTIGTRQEALLLAVELFRENEGE